MRAYNFLKQRRLSKHATNFLSRPYLRKNTSVQLKHAKVQTTAASPHAAQPQTKISTNVGAPQKTQVTKQPEKTVAKSTRRSQNRVLVRPHSK